MARLPDINNFNEERIKAIKIKTAIDDAVVLTTDETKKILRDFINEDFVKARKINMGERLEFKIRQFENSIVKHIDDKLDKITEKIVELIINRVVENEVEKRLNKKLEKLKNSL